MDADDTLPAAEDLADGDVVDVLGDSAMPPARPWTRSPRPVAVRWSSQARSSRPSRVGSPWTTSPSMSRQER